MHNRNLLPMVRNSTNINLEMLLPESMSTTTNNHIFKYVIGDKFADPEHEGDSIEITGYNWLSRTYQGVVNMKFGNVYKRQTNHLIFESKLDKMAMIVEPFVEKPKETKFHYRIHYFDTKTANTSRQQDVTLTNIRALCKLLNSMVKIKPDRRIITVSVIDENGCYVSSVKFLRREIKEQKFLTGMKERLLAHAKYECGYEVATNF